MAKTFLILLSILFSIQSFAQVNYPDSINELFKNKELTPQLIDELNKYSSDLYYENTNVNYPKQLLDKIENLSLKIDYQKGLADVYMKFSVFYRNENIADSALFYNKKSIKLIDKKEYFDDWYDENLNLIELFLKYHKVDSAIKYTKALIEVTKNLNDSIKKAIPYSILGKAYTQKEDFPPAIDAYKKAEKYFPEYSYKNLAIFYNGMGITYFLIKKNDLSRKYYMKAMYYDEKTDEIDIRNSTYNNLARLYHANLNKLDSAIYYYNKGLDLEENKKDKLPLSYYINLGNVYLDKKDYDETIKYYLKAYESESIKSRPMHNTAVTINLGVVYYETKDFEKSEEFLHKGLGMAKEYKLYEFQKNAYISLADLSKTQNNIEDLSRYKDSIITLTKRMWDERLNNKVAELEASLEFEKLENDKALLQHEKELNDKKLFLYQIIIALVVILLLVLITLMISIRKSKLKINEINENLQQKNKELISLNQDLSELNQTKDKFFSIIAHDLKGPIGSTSNLISQLQSNFDYFDQGTKQEILESLSKTGKATFELLENLLDWARTQKGEIKYNEEEFDIENVVFNVFSILESKAKYKNQKLLYNSNSGKIIVKTDKKMLNTILVNLVNNAIKFSEDNKEIKLDAEIEGDKVKIIVKDEGIGISEKQRAKLFDISSKTSTRGTKNEGGTGLGLIIAKEFAEIMNAKLFLEKSDKNGTTFILHIKLKN